MINVNELYEVQNENRLVTSNGKKEVFFLYNEGEFIGEFSTNRRQLVEYAHEKGMTNYYVACTTPSDFQEVLNKLERQYKQAMRIAMYGR